MSSSKYEKKEEQETYWSMKIINDWMKWNEWEGKELFNYINVELKYIEMNMNGW